MFSRSRRKNNNANVAKSTNHANASSGVVDGPSPKKVTSTTAAASGAPVQASTNNRNKAAAISSPTNKAPPRSSPTSSGRSTNKKYRKDEKIMMVQQQQQQTPRKTLKQQQSPQQQQYQQSLPQPQQQQQQMASPEKQQPQSPEESLSQPVSPTGFAAAIMAARARATKKSSSTSLSSHSKELSLGQEQEIAKKKKEEPPAVVVTAVVTKPKPTPKPKPKATTAAENDFAKAIRTRATNTNKGSGLSFEQQLLNAGLARKGSSGSSSSTASLTRSHGSESSSSPPGAAAASSSSLECSSSLTTKAPPFVSALQQPPIVMQQQQQHNDGPISSNNNSNHSSTNTTTTSLNTNTTITTSITNNAHDNNKEDVTISTIQNECTKLSLAMSKLRKYSSEWFYLEKKLKNALEELEAAKEDRDLQYYDCYSMKLLEDANDNTNNAGGACGDLVQQVQVKVHPVKVKQVQQQQVVGMTMTPNTPLSPSDLEVAQLNATPDNASSGSNNANANPTANAGVGVGVPKTVFLASLLEEQQQQQQQQQQQEQHHDNQKREQEQLATSSIQTKLNTLAKFSPEWFAVKEELVELMIALDEEGGCGKQLGAVAAAASVNNDENKAEKKTVEDGTTTTRRRSVGSGTTNGSSARASNKSKGGSRSSNNQNKSTTTQGINSKPPPPPPYSNDTPPFNFRPISPQPKSSSSSSTSQMKIILSPLPRSPSPIPHASSISSPLDLSSPYHTMSNPGSPESRCLSKSSHSNIYYSKSAMMQRGHDDDENSDNENEEKKANVNVGNNTHAIAGDSAKITSLREQHNQATNELNTLTQFTKEWFDTKTKIVTLEDEIEAELQHTNDSGVVVAVVEHSSTATTTTTSRGRGHSRTESSDSSTTDTLSLRNKSYMSGWTSTYSESEDEILSMADDLECCMVAEALSLQHPLSGGNNNMNGDPTGKQNNNGGYQRSPYDGSNKEEDDENEEDGKDEALILQPVLSEEDHGIWEKDQGLWKSANAAIKLQAWVRATRQRKQYRRVKQANKLKLDKHKKYDAAVRIQSLARGRWQLKRYKQIHLAKQAKIEKQRRADAAVKIQSLARGRIQCRKVRKQLEERKKVRLQKEQEEREEQKRLADLEAWKSKLSQEEPKDEFSSMLDDFASMLNDDIENDLGNGLHVTEDEAAEEMQSFYITIIQDQWKKYYKCRPFKRMKRGAIKYKDVATEQHLYHEDHGLQGLVSQWQLFAVNKGKEGSLQAGVSQWQLYSSVLIQSRWRGYRAQREFVFVVENVVMIQSMVRCVQQRREYAEELQLAKESVTKIQSLARCKQQRVQYVNLRRQTSDAVKIQTVVRRRISSLHYTVLRTKIITVQTFQRKKVAHSLYLQVLSSTSIIQRAWRCALARTAAEEAVAAAEERRKYQELKSSAIKVQTLVRSRQQYQRYSQQRAMSVSIQTFLRAIWVATGQLYTDQRTVLFYSTSLGIKLHRGLDGYVRVLSITDALSPDDLIEGEEEPAPTVRDGKVAPGDLVLEAAGINLRSPLSRSQWGNAVNQIRNASRPMQFLVASGERRLKMEVLGDCEFVSAQLTSLLSVVKMQRAWREYCGWKCENQASTIIQSRVRQWLARCTYERELLLAECEVTLKQLQMLAASIVVQSQTRRWLAQSSFSRQVQSSVTIQTWCRMLLQKSQFIEALATSTRSAVVIQTCARKQLAQSSYSRKLKSSILVQTWLRMEVRKRRYRQALISTALIQAFIRGYLVRKNPVIVTKVSLPPPSPEKLQDKVFAISMELSEMQEFTPEWTYTAALLQKTQEQLRTAVELESRQDAEQSSKGVGDTKENNSLEREGIDEGEDREDFSFAALRAKLAKTSLPKTPQGDKAATAPKKVKRGPLMLKASRAKPKSPPKQPTQQLKSEQSYNLSEREGGDEGEDFSFAALRGKLAKASLRISPFQKRAKAKVPPKQPPQQEDGDHNFKALRQNLQKNASVPIFPQEPTSSARAKPTSPSTSPSKPPQPQKIEEQIDASQKVDVVENTHVASVSSNPPSAPVSSQNAPTQVTNSSPSKEAREAALAKAVEVISNGGTQAEAAAAAKEEAQRVIAQKRKEEENRKATSPAAAAQSMVSYWEAGPSPTKKNEQKDERHQMAADVENENVPSVSNLRQNLEANPSSVPIFPQKAPSPTKKVPASHSNNQAPPVPHARSGEKWSPENELRNISNVTNNKKNMERSTTPAESSGSSGKKKRQSSRRLKKKEPTPAEKMRTLSMDSINLSQRVSSLPKFSPEWTLSKMELKMVTDELEFLYNESMGRG